MRRMFAVIIAASAAWVCVQMLTARRAGPAAPAPKPVETWENEGGALAPHRVAVETSQIPR